MCAPEHLKSLAPSSACTASVQRQTDAAGPRMQYEDLGQEREEECRRSLHSLQKCICELLTRNQELRMSLLNSTIEHQSREGDQ